MKISQLNFESTKILVIGDVMLDQYWFGKTARISPEAPVPVVHFNNMEEKPGGAANVAVNIRALGAEAYLLGLIGDDSEGESLEKLLKQRGLFFHLEKIKNFTTITKRRILSRHQQMLRLDTEKSFDAEHGQALKTSYLEFLPKVNAVILSDYGKGTLKDSAWFIQQAKKQGLPVFVDPKSNDFEPYRGATVITPNLKEFEAVVGPCAHNSILVEKASQLIQKYEIQALVVTRSEQGISLITDNEAHHLPAKAQEILDVTGAGDTVMSTLTTAFASGLDLLNATTLGNIAAGIAIGKLGAATVSVAELLTALHVSSSQNFGIMTESALLSAVALSKAQGERIIFTNGCFDILQAGHVQYLREAKRLGDRVIVGINDDASVTRLKGPDRPINRLENRMAVLAALKSVDWVVPFSEDTPERLIRAIQPHVLAKGGDYKKSLGDNLKVIPGAEFVLSQGGEVKLLGEDLGCSNTSTINKILKQQQRIELHAASEQD